MPHAYLPTRYPLHKQPASDYAIVRAAIAYLTENAREQPDLDALARALGQDPFMLQKLFKRWAGLSPKSFLQAVTLDHAKTLLRGSSSVLDTALEVGLSGPGRLHDLFVTHEAMSPGVFKARGAGITIFWAFHPSPFGHALIMVSEHGLTGLAFCDEGDEPQTYDDMTSRWPNAEYVQDSIRTAPFMSRIFNREEWRPDQPLRIVFIGSDFEVRVWETLLKIPFGKAATYGEIALHLEKPKGAARAVGSAVGKNPISFVVPCHRVLGTTGKLCGYHWGLTRKQAILGWETGL
ncbi:MAG: bifunctional helix-turn-helix domain-containing protein/methylated-DNA--[protein]-cysteine S-methyltransferase [Rhizobiales bacterium]|nr:bifunctional helix-turn-helix domain-containing protein/methylated-DNA--[protein]-cysteine S-methyltransferase [Hyphomicrobiales bacterium]